MLKQWMKQPLVTKPEIGAAHVGGIDFQISQTLGLRGIFSSEYSNSTGYASTCHHYQRHMLIDLKDSHLKQIPDMTRLCKRLQRKSATLDDIVGLFQFSIRLPALLLELEGVPSDVMTEYTDKLRV